MRKIKLLAGLFTMMLVGVISQATVSAEEIRGEWREENGEFYWYENDVKQGTEGRGKEIYDPGTKAWYWLDAEFGGRKAVSKDVYQESESGIWGDLTNEDGITVGKWVRYDENGHMVKGWDGDYYFDPIYGTMAKGYATIDGNEYYFNAGTGVKEQELGEVPEFGWKNINGNEFWYENGIRQGYSVKAGYRGKEIFDPKSNAWYWLDNVDGGKKATNKDVYQESQANDVGDIGKWVRYDENGHMVKGWNEKDGEKYYFDPIYGTMAKGEVEIEGTVYYFNVDSGICEGEYQKEDEIVEDEKKEDEESTEEKTEDEVIKEEEKVPDGTFYGLEIVPFGETVTRWWHGEKYYENYGWESWNTEMPITATVEVTTRKDGMLEKTVTYQMKGGISMEGEWSVNMYDYSTGKDLEAAGYEVTASETTRTEDGSTVVWSTTIVYNDDVDPVFLWTQVTHKFEMCYRNTETNDEEYFAAKERSLDDYKDLLAFEGGKWFLATK